MCALCETKSPALSRRRLLGSGAGLLAAATLGAGTAWAKDANKDAKQPVPNAISADEALKRIMDGNARYAAGNLDNKDFSAGRAARATAQYPIAAIVSCADSRVAPELVFDQAPGELFVVRVAGNFVNDDGLASLEYGVKFLGIPLVLVLGHSGCGAVDATIKVLKDGTKLPGHLPELVNALKPGVEAAIARKPQDLLAEATKENVRHNVQRLSKAKPIVSSMVADGKVKIIGGVYDIESGRVVTL
ncbi:MULTISPECIES: carbonic anhydrase [unclassified Bradyrhizobium]|uniref:carbonic anhydrase n=1 Tax=unclassified Bradyrhizobium TaxID=2631580 RepID=UPI0028E3B51A|nr:MULTISPECIES: carbonic anhydrase [unclassified Bradyrhizobium]